MVLTQEILDETVKIKTFLRMENHEWKEKMSWVIIVHSQKSKTLILLNCIVDDRKKSDGVF